jgi:prepilin-type N-terminal cleavage/methylation domain-containing protein
MKSVFMRDSNETRKRKGFSLMELVAVLAILSLLALITLRIADGVRERSMIARGESELAALRGALDRYRSHFGDYPIIREGSEEDRNRRLVQALMGQSDPEGAALVNVEAPFLEFDSFFMHNGLLLDPWEHPYFFSYDPEWPHGQYFLLSKGPDGEAVLPGTHGRYAPAQSANRDNLEGVE